MARQPREETDSKAQLVREICSTGSMFAACTHRRRPPAFVDWYLVLGVDEEEKVDAIRKRYRQLGRARDLARALCLICVRMLCSSGNDNVFTDFCLLGGDDFVAALQLHPDKNKHPKADVAFKLVSEAYECLSDKAKRNAFNSQRWSNLCKECYRRSRSKEHVHRQRCWQSTGQASSYKVMNNLRQMQKRFREECEVIESCMRANQSYWKESPVFSPYEQLLSSPGYPHSRGATLEKPMSSSHWQARDQCGRGAGCESPIYEIRKHNYPRSRSFCFRF
nr:PREDICTED: uncharacterized protein LOC103996845 isoform X1 [Musa acuminata subsp. malaccensis]